MKALITGGAGFIGSNLAERLLKSGAAKVTVFDNFSSGRREFLPEDRPGLKIIEGELLDPESLQGVLAGHDMVFHLASNPNIARGAEDPGLDLKSSVIATYNLLESMRRQGVKRILYFSGSGVYGDQKGMATAEDFGPLLPVSPYGAGKLGAEAQISSFCHMFDMQAHILRPANIVGRRQTHGVIFDFIEKLEDNPRVLTILGDGRQKKPYIHIDDVLDAIEFVVENGGGRIDIFNLSTSDTSDVNWIAGKIIEKMNLTDVEIKYTGGSTGWQGDVPQIILDTRKLETLGWKPKLNSKQAIEAAVSELLGKAEK